MDELMDGFKVTFELFSPVRNKMLHGLLPPCVILHRTQPPPLSICPLSSCFVPNGVPHGDQTSAGADRVEAGNAP